MLLIKARKTSPLTEMHREGWKASNQTQITDISSRSYDKVLGNWFTLIFETMGWKKNRKMHEKNKTTWDDAWICGKEKKRIKPSVTPPPNAYQTKERIQASHGADSRKKPAMRNGPQSPRTGGVPESVDQDTREETTSSINRQKVSEGCIIWIS